MCGVKIHLSDREVLLFCYTLKVWSGFWQIGLDWTVFTDHNDVTSQKEREGGGAGLPLTEKDTSVYTIGVSPLPYDGSLFSHHLHIRKKRVLLCVEKAQYLSEGVLTHSSSTMYSWSSERRALLPSFSPPSFFFPRQCLRSLASHFHAASKRGGRALRTLLHSTTT